MNTRDIENKISFIYKSCNHKQLWTAWRWSIRYILHNLPMGIKDGDFYELRSYLLCEMKFKSGYWFDIIFDMEVMKYWRKYGKYS